MPKEIRNRCNVDICKGVCCTFLSFHYDKRLTDDFKRFLMLRGIEIKEEWIRKSFKRMLRTHLKIPVVCQEFDHVKRRCKIYEDRPRHCAENPTKPSPFINKNLCSVFNSQLLTILPKGNKDAKP